MKLNKLLPFLVGVIASSFVMPYLIRFVVWILEPDYIRCNAGRIEP